MFRSLFVLTAVASAVICKSGFHAPAQAQPAVASRTAMRSVRPEANADAVESGMKAEVKFEGLHAISEIDLLKALSEKGVDIAKTFVYDPAKTQEAAALTEKLLAQHGYISAAVEVREEGVFDGVKAITLVVEEGKRPPLAEIEFEGASAISSERLAAKVRKCLSDFSDSSEEYDGRKFDRCLDEARDLLRRSGYNLAKFGEKKEELIEEGLKVTVPVEEGARFRLGRITVKGSKVFLPAQIAEALDLTTGNVSDFDRLREAVNRLWGMYADRGYLDCEMDFEPDFGTSADDAQEGVVDYQIEIYEGRPYTISSIKFIGNTRKTEQQLRDVLSISEGEIYNQRKFRDNLERLRQLGVFDGYDQMGYGGGSWKGFERRQHDEAGLLEIIIHLDEEDTRTAPHP